MTTASIQSGTDLNLVSLTDFGGWSADPARVDYANRAYRAMAPRWQIVHDVLGGTTTLRDKRNTYLPKFESEDLRDWESRVKKTFAYDHYDSTLNEHTGLVMGEPPALDDDVPEVIADMMEDVDGEGNHLDVFLWNVLYDAFHFGHGGIFTDYPVATAIKFKRDELAANLRPYATWYKAPDILDHRTVVFNGRRTLVYIKFRETPEGAEQTEFTYREIEQDVGYDVVTGRATSLGQVMWRTFKAQQDPTTKAESFVPTGSGVISFPAGVDERIAFRPVYGGTKTGYLQSKPHLYGLALTSIEQTQVKSDYANIMHKCNVPTPIFIGRTALPPGAGGGDSVQMGVGIDIPIGGDAKYLEPSGTALGATRDRLNDLSIQMQKQGASSTEMGGKAMTATEAAIYAKQRNAKLTRAARSVQDAAEGMLQDFAAFTKQKSGGSLTINTNFAGVLLDPNLLNVFIAAYREGIIPLDAVMFALENGKLPDDFTKDEAALKLIAQAMADAEAALAAPKPPEQVPPTDGGTPPEEKPAGEPVVE